jgi:hypothetical protein
MIFWTLKKFQVPQFFNYECFSYVDGRLSSFQKKSHQLFFTKKVLNLLFYKFDFGCSSSKVFYQNQNLIYESKMI